MKYLIAALLCAGVLCSTRADDLHVDNVRGREKGPGTQEAPFKTIGEALKVLKSGDTLHLAANDGVPYEEVIDTHPIAKWGGTPEKPTIIDGHGATITGLRHLPAADWKDEGDGIFSRRLQNNAWSMDQQGHWSGHPIVFFDGQPAEFRKDKASLSELTYFLHKDHPDKRTTLHNTLYIKLPTGKTPDDVKVVSIGAQTILHISRSYITVKNLTIVYAADDAFATTQCRGLVFDNIRGAYCMDQGISNHGAEAIVKNSRFDHNTVSGIVDVYPEAKVKYLNCVVENNLRGGVEFYSGEYAMENCIIRHNKGAGITVNRDAKVRLSNCYIEAEEKKFRGVDVGTGGLTMEHCTIYNAGEAVASYLSNNPETFAVTNCAFINNRQNLDLTKAEGVEANNIQFGQNTYTPGGFRVFGTTYSAHKWAEYQQATGLDGDSVMQTYEGPLPPLQTDLEKVLHIAGKPSSTSAPEVCGGGGMGDDLLPVFAKGLAGKPLRIVAMGGSITQAGGGWISPWMQKRFPSAKVEMFNAGMSGTGSGLGVFRVGRDVIAHDPDLVLIEFAVNDRGGADEDVVRSMESLIVRLKSLAKPPAVVLVNVAARDGADHRRHACVAEHYGLLAMDLQAAVAVRLEKTGGAWTDLMSDDVHPHGKGHALYAEAIAAALEPFVERAARTPAAPPPVLPQPLSKHPLVLDGRMVPLEPQAGWTRVASLPSWWTKFFPDGFIRTSEPGTMLTLDVRATEIGLLLPLDSGTYGTFYANLDGGEPRMMDAGFRGGYTTMMLGSDLTPAEHRVRICVGRPFDGGTPPVYLGYLLVAGEAAATGPTAPQGNIDLCAHALRRFEPVPAAQWEWCGPFGGDQPTRGGLPTADLERPFEPETSGGSGWKRATGDAAFVNFVPLGARPDRGVCYARATVTRAAGGEVLAALRLDYFAKLWVNGRLVKTVDGDHGHPMRPMFIPIELREGENQLQIKVHAGSGGSGFSLYLLAEGEEQDP